jgi:4-amino-4-deoxy-L-arabinose transferase-like glycosyltransferase
MTEEQPPSESSEPPEPSILDALKDVLKGRRKISPGSFLKPQTPSDGDKQRTETVESKPESVASEAPAAGEPAKPRPTIRHAFSQVWHADDAREDVLGKASPFRLSPSQIAFWGSVLLAIVLILSFRFYRLDDLQSEIYGDIVTVYDYSNAVMSYQWLFDFILSAGPFYFYLIWPLLAFAGLSYWSLKLASVLVSLLTLVFTYLFARELVDDWFALLTTAIAGVSSWLLIFSRLGNFPIAVPLVVMADLWLLARFVRTQSRWDLFWCSLVAALGLYIYPQTFILPLAIVLTLIALRWLGHKVQWSSVFSMIAVIVAASLPWLFFIFLKSPESWFEGYVGGKLTDAQHGLPIMLGNIVNSLGAFHIRGDDVSRTNPAGLPHLDLLSGLLFLLGFAFWMSPSRRRWLPLIMIPFLVLQFPSILVLANPHENPSATRTLGIAPIAYLLCASGLWMLAQMALKLFSRRTAFIASMIVFLLITAINGQRYFDTYIHGLPYHNTPIAGLAADYANRLPPGTNVYLVDCCWDGGMPEPKGMRYSMFRPSELNELKSNDLTCGLLDGLRQPAVLIWSERRDLPSDNLADCADKLTPQTYYSLQGLPIFRAASLGAGGAVTAVINPEPVAPTAPKGLMASQAILDEVPVTVYHSALDMGQVSDIFDSNNDSLIRGAEDNPFVVEIHFEHMRKLGVLDITLGTMNHFLVKVMITYDDDTTAEVSGDYSQLPSDPTVTLELPVLDKFVKILHIEIEDIREQPAEGYHIHVREISVR